MDEEIVKEVAFVGAGVRISSCRTAFLLSGPLLLRVSVQSLF